jgi:3-dehydroquinate dehydratase
MNRQKFLQEFRLAVENHPECVFELTQNGCLRCLVGEVYTCPITFLFWHREGVAEGQIRYNTLHLKWVLTLIA